MFAAAFVRGVRKGGSFATLKHFACNNQEKCRTKLNAVVSERALREIYLKGFETAVKQGGANAVMTSYNPVNGYWTASSYDLNTTVLRREWGFKGIVMTDWWATMNDCINGGPSSSKFTGSMIRAQNDLYMVVNNFGAEINSNGDDTIVSLKNGSLTRGELQRCAINILNFLMQAPVFFRDHAPRETVGRFTAKKGECREPVQDLEKDHRIVISDGKAWFRVTEEGEYRGFANIMSTGDRLSQSGSNIFLNDNYMTHVQTSGTEGRWIRQKLVKVYLEKGLYELKISVVSPGMVIERIEFIKE